MKAAMYLLFEDGAQIKVATLSAQQGESWQAESANGKRIKIKDRDVLLKFSHPAATELMEQASLLAGNIDIPFLWECAPDEEFGFIDFANEYFGASADAIQRVALVLALHNNPVYFRRKGRGRFQRAPQEQLNLALAALERKKAQILLQQEYEAMLAQRILPKAFIGKAINLLFKPDKNSIEFKALEQAAKALNISPTQLLIEAGGIASPLALHEARFMADYFPQGCGFPPLAPLRSLPDLPLADVQAFSIDDSQTTEIDDAFSVTPGAVSGQWRIGIHIAAPALGIMPNDALDTIARQRLSTVYLPGKKMTMLPEEVIAAFTLQAGQTCPAVSLYLTVDEITWDVLKSETRIEQITVAHNLRHDLLGDVVTEANLAVASGDYPCKDALAVLWPFANHLHQIRQDVRASHGLRPESHTRPDYSYYLDTHDDGHTTIRIEPRQRGAPLDKMVAELMILANSTWGHYLAEANVPGIYRTQRGWGLVRTRMQTTPAPHEGLGVAQYAWSTSPLRRYVDLINQWQIIAVAQHGVAAKMVAPFAAHDVHLMAITADFEATYTGYLNYQNTMERYWCLRWLQQEKRTYMQAMVLKDSTLRLTDIPLVLQVPELEHQPLARGKWVLLEIGEIDEIELTVRARLLEILEQPMTGESALENQEKLSDTLHKSGQGLTFKEAAP